MTRRIGSINNPIVRNRPLRFCRSVSFSLHSYHLREVDIVSGTSYLNLKLSRFHHFLHTGIPKCQAPRWEGFSVKVFVAPALIRSFLNAFRLADRSSHGTEAVAYIQLHYLFAIHLAGVLHFYRYRQLILVGQYRITQRTIHIFKSSVTLSAAKGSITGRGASKI